MRFTKMHGAGNDYVYVDCFENSAPPDPSRLARIVSDRHKGVGADGLILIEPSNIADAGMRMWNADGGEAEMCGNGVRCVAKYLFDRKLVQSDSLEIETAAGVRRLDLDVRSNQVVAVRVNMGRPVEESSRIPTLLPGDPPVKARLDVGHLDFEVTCVSIGNPHCVIFLDDQDELDEFELSDVGPRIEVHPVFPNHANVEFVHVESANEVACRVWERGTGETQACGTGACAVCVAGVLTGVTDRELSCRLPGGTLEVEWSEDGDVYLTGPAVEVYTGDWPDARM